MTKVDIDKAFDFSQQMENEKKKKERVKKKVKKANKEKQREPLSSEEIEKEWQIILYKRKNTAKDQLRLEETYQAWKEGKIHPDPTVRRFSKAEALRMYWRLVDINRKEKLKEMVENTPSNYHLVQTEDQLEQVCDWFEKEKLVALDTETDGLDVLYGKNKLVGICLSFPTIDQHVYIPIRHNEGKQLPVDLVIKKLKPYLEDTAKRKVLHNAKFDAHVLKMEGITLRGIEMDTMVAMWVLNENEPTYRLKDLANKYAKYMGIKPEHDTFEELFGNSSFNEIPLDVALVYAAKDTDLTLKFYQFIERQLQREDLQKIRRLYYKLENPLIEVCIEMEQNGFLLNEDKADEIRKQLYKQKDEIERKLIEIFGDINFNSPAQLSKVLYDDMKLPDISGQRSTDKTTLKKLAEEHKQIKLLLDYREVTKLLSSFIDKLPEMKKRTGRVHGQFIQSATHTGRFASREPNLQQLPTEARVMFQAPKGYVIIGADFSQIEPRVLAHMSGDTELQRPYKEGQDLYSTLASKTLGLPMEYCLDGAKDPQGREPRKMMKTGLLAVMYGTSMFTLSNQLEIPVEEAEQFINDFYKAYPKVDRWIKSVWEFVKENEYVETLYGRKRRFPRHKQKARLYDQLATEICRRLGTDSVPNNFWEYKQLPYKLKRQFQNVKGSVERVRRQAVNAIIQGSAADIMKIALLRLQNLCDKYEGWKILGTVHDEAILEVPETITPEQVAEIEQAMVGAVQLDVPLKVDVAFMYEWGNEISKDEWFR